MELWFLSIELTSSRQRTLFTFGVHLVQSSLSAAAQLYASKPLLQVVYFFWPFQWQAWALAHSPAHHVNKLFPAVQYVWFGWHWGLEKSPMLPPPRPTPLPLPTHTHIHTPPSPNPIGPFRTSFDQFWHILTCFESFCWQLSHGIVCLQ